MQARQIALLVGEDEWLIEQLSGQLRALCRRNGESAVLFYAENAPHLALDCPYQPVSFSQARNRLGQEAALIIYDARYGIHLDALAVAGGGLQAGGLLLLLFNRWRTLQQQIDMDSLRWSGEACGIRTPNFIRFFQRHIARCAFPVYRQQDMPRIDLSVPRPSCRDNRHVPTAEQRAVLQRILSAQADIFVLTAKRGRGKSALAGMLAAQLSHVLITAPNKSAVNILREFAGVELPFIAPDELCRQIARAPQRFVEYWLIIDEAAMIPLPLLRGLTSAFKHILCTTTVQSYEGTGRGFLLKFMQKTDRTLCHLTLSAPLRWRADDKVEPFIDALLLLDAEQALAQPQPRSQVGTSYQICRFPRQQLLAQERYREFYGLLTLAHYKTSPSDLRRLFDASGQHFWLADSKDGLLGCLWGVTEGGLHDAALITDIQRGVRRPRGNLAAQMLCQQTGLAAACSLRSVRISRIAVRPDRQRQGIGRQLVEALAQQGAADFVSVSFGYTPSLMTFWRCCGFQIVCLGEHREASSGCYSALAVRALSAAGEAFCQQAGAQFRRNIGLSFHPLAAHFMSEAPDWTLRREDRLSLQNFADFHRTLAAALPAIRRLLHCLATRQGALSGPLLTAYCRQRDGKPASVAGKKQWLKACRMEVKEMLQKYESLL
ncbi:tRNA(Met) cytidine acetyltransferase TmcA [Necropsobacter rosorum]|uniref:tRNA(Met) cytidine acetyltransferase TmcA n=1 Tax=Necropsobacter rosorum TaxID=908285 RepID=UPI000509706E